MDCRTLENKVRYVLERNPQAAVSDRYLTLAVWHMFYAHLLDPEGRLGFLSAIDLPSVHQVASARRRAIARQRTEAVASAERSFGP